MKKRDILELKIEGMEFGGNSYGYIEDRRVDIKGGITGQTHKVLIKKIRKDKVEAKSLGIIENSPIEKADICKHFGECGGCSILSVPYEEQLEIKEGQILDLFMEKDFVGFKFLGVEGSPKFHEYRNKMEYTFGDEEKDGPLTLGLHKKGRMYDIITVDECFLVDKDFREVLKSTVDYFQSTGLPYYKNLTHKGYLRNLVVRKGLNTGEMLINLVTSSQVKFNLDEYVNKILDLDIEGKIVGILHTINDGLADVVKCDKLNILYGRDYLYESLLGLRFKISPFSFFQTNTKGAEKLYSIAREFIGDEKDKVIFDLYSGTGSIAQIVSKNAKKVIGIEIIEEAVEAAIENAKLNNITNCEFIAGDVGEKVKTLKEKPDLIIVDPPRPGIHKDALKDIVKFNAKEILYISCNPKTLVRDLAEFKKANYDIVKVKGMDMFPNTPHVETVVLLTRK
ncbi:23S rRNA (uracil(1939)-C(5))-methyltransferase RlmD [Tepidibacter formicigenes]|uniref:23S rRNA (Uracil-5-)-methyltransferase RumA n=1 Tax=Tepidibacter formicigenes DSM 15518 TaxID=1123349 RepID=A0A1M6N8N3_9FIRM|nr:23S rRNA (uracil(1939)-C(5))-methyltransferase RlmD [Tepidibacter formicigenes]SHJ92068.1 23S rRNA (uracil-5-)-methyltransferase RumA [Tepidibacter formicigenes DSM 15518]